MGTLKNLFSDDENVQHEAIVRASAKLITWIILGGALFILLAVLLVIFFFCSGAMDMTGLWDG